MSNLERDLRALAETTTDREVAPFLLDAAEALKRWRERYEVTAAERDLARGRAEHFVGLFANVWKFAPDDIKAPDGRMMRFVDPDPHRTLAVVKQTLDSAFAEPEVAKRLADS